MSVSVRIHICLVLVYEIRCDAGSDFVREKLFDLIITLALMGLYAVAAENVHLTYTFTEIYAQRQ